MQIIHFSGVRIDLPRNNFEFEENGNQAKVWYRGQGEIEYDVNPDNDSEELEPFVRIGENRYWLQDFMRFDHKNSFISINFDGYCTTSNTGGDLIVLDDFAFIYSI